MNAAIAVGTTQEALNRGSLVQEIPLANISESKTSPRSQYDAAKLAELAANVKQHGVLQPVVVRPHPNGVPDTFELVVGSRRFRASKLARQETIPATLRELSDAESAEIQLLKISSVKMFANWTKPAVMARFYTSIPRATRSRPSL